MHCFLHTEPDHPPVSLLLTPSSELDNKEHWQPDLDFKNIYTRKITSYFQAPTLRSALVFFSHSKLKASGFFPASGDLCSPAGSCSRYQTHPPALATEHCSASARTREETETDTEEGSVCKHYTCTSTNPLSGSKNPPQFKMCPLLITLFWFLQGKGDSLGQEIHKNGLGLQHTGWTKWFCLNAHLKNFTWYVAIGNYKSLQKQTNPQE